MKFTRNEARGFLVSSKEEYCFPARIIQAIAILRGSDRNYYEDEK